MTEDGTMRKVLPNHLHLGSRLHKASPEIMVESARVSDFVSINRYMPPPVTRPPATACKPVLIAEFAFGAPRPPTAGRHVFAGLHRSGGSFANASKHVDQREAASGRTMIRLTPQPAPAASRDTAGQWIGFVDPNSGGTANSRL